VTLFTLTYCCVQISIAQSRNRGQKHLLSEVYYTIEMKAPPYVACSKAFDIRGCVGGRPWGCEAVETGEAQAPRAQGTKNQFRGHKTPSAYDLRTARNRQSSSQPPPNQQRPSPRSEPPRSRQGTRRSPSGKTQEEPRHSTGNSRWISG